MFGRLWRESRALTCLQLGYELTLKAPLPKADEITLRAACKVSADIGGNEWDSAALYMLSVASGILETRSAALTDADRSFLSNAVGRTLGIGVSGRMKRPDILMARAKEVGDRYKRAVRPPSSS